MGRKKGPIRVPSLPIEVRDHQRSESARGADLPSQLKLLIVQALSEDRDAVSLRMLRGTDSTFASLSRSVAEDRTARRH